MDLPWTIGRRSLASMTDHEQHEACERATFESIYDEARERWSLRPILAAAPIEETDPDAGADQVVR